jgi:integrating conjugative element protein (TIGR03749 family)
MKQSYLAVTVIALLFYSVISSADSHSKLTLTDAEMQKLKMYFPSDDSEHLNWKGDPLAISLPINKEKRIVFSEKISVDLKGSLNTEQLRVLNNDKSLYFTAFKSFEAARIFVTLKESGEVLLIDLVTDEDASHNTQYIDTKLKKVKNSSVVENSSSFIKDVTYVDLIRFAWQQAYASERLTKNTSEFSRAPMHTKKFISGLLYGDKVTAFPQASWMAGNHYVTIVLLRNKYSHPTHIDISKDLCGQWQAATIYPRSDLMPYVKMQNDSSVLFLVSSQPFGKMLEVCNGNA